MDVVAIFSMHKLQDHEPLMETKIEEMKEELKQIQFQQFHELKCQQKQLLQLQNMKRQPQNNQKQEFLMDTKIEHLKEELKEVFKKQCKDIQITVNNVTKQQGLLQNLVLDVVNNKEEQSREEDIEANNKCVICLDKSLCVALRPCGHVIACFECAQKLPKECPICRKTISDTLRIYFP